MILNMSKVILFRNQSVCFSLMIWSANDKSPTKLILLNFEWDFILQKDRKDRTYNTTKPHQLLQGNRVRESKKRKDNWKLFFLVTRIFILPWIVEHFNCSKFIYPHFESLNFKITLAIKKTNSYYLIYHFIHMHWVYKKPQMPVF